MFTGHLHVPLGHEGIARALNWWIEHRDDGPARKIEKVFEDAVTEDEGVEAAWAIARRTVRSRRPLPAKVGAPDAAYRRFLDAYAAMMVGRVLGAAVVGSEHHRAMFEVRAAYLPQVSSCAVENELSYSGDELRAMGEQMVVTFDLAGAFDDLLSH
ncbi:hypothetical protein SHKM778_78330 [Streptomyces sp. KM77-8]|uniref:Uncharacterized protein n=1 Tax=Streptomyces haneummycinicus TaxID=3074435 RepID=A0AAT9HWD5_9ACTN